MSLVKRVGMQRTVQSVRYLCGTRSQGVPAKRSAAARTAIHSLMVKWQSIARSQSQHFASSAKTCPSDAAIERGKTFLSAYDGDHQAGFTLVELLFVVMALTSIVMFALIWCHARYGSNGSTS